MPAEGACRDVQARLTDVFFARGDPEVDDLAHARTCSACADHRDHLLALTDALDSEPVAVVLPARVEAMRRRALAELAGAGAPTAARAGEVGLPIGFRRELLRLLLWAVLPLPALLLWYAALVRVGGALLAGVLPTFFVYLIGFAFAVGTASWLALIYGAIPFFAHRRALYRRRGVSE
jgi:hypothetical protein